MAPRTRRLLILLLLVALGAVAAVAFGVEPARRGLVDAFSGHYEQQRVGGPLAAVFEGKDAQREQRAISLDRVATGITQPTDIQFPPGSDGVAVVLEKTGTARWLELASGHHGPLFHVDVLTASEEGLLGIAFHPGFAENGRFFIDYVATDGGKDVSFIAEWKLSTPRDVVHAKASPVRVLLKVVQPYQNHNAGQLAFGPDGKLYIGFGDGGFRDDPKGNGQNPNVLLGKMLRVDVDGTSDAQPYRVPPDNPFVGKPGYRPEIWALGLRNPWRYSFDPQGRLVVADVGQDAWEEVDIVQAGDDLGWQLREGFTCTRKDKAACDAPGLVAPIFVYPREDGHSITGGYVYTGARVPALRGLYVFADFVSNRLFALQLPADRKTRVAQPIALGRWPVMPSAFGRDGHGELYLVSFASGDVFRIGPARSGK
jgi:glucose/arabinose dehydrogenase